MFAVNYHAFHVGGNLIVVVVNAVLMGSGNTHRGDLIAQSNDFEVFLKVMLLIHVFLLCSFPFSAVHPFNQSYPLSTSSVTLT